jgi:hypothetical protein
MSLQPGKGPATKDTSGRNLPRLGPSEPKGQAHELLFINQHHDRAKHGPSRRIIGSHVQRHIHRRKRLNSCLRLKSNPRDDVHHVKNIHIHSQPDSALSGSVPRRKSKPTPQKAASEARSRQDSSFAYRVPQNSPTNQGTPLDLATIPSPTELPRDRHGFRFDPFDSYPIEFRESIPPAVDYCKQPSPYAVHADSFRSPPLLCPIS